MSTARGQSLRDNLIARVLRKIGKSDRQNMSDQQMSFVVSNVDLLLLNGSIAARDVTALAHKFHANFPEYSAPPPRVASPLTARAGGAPSESPVKTPVPPRTASSLRDISIARADPRSKAPPPAHTPVNIAAISSTRPAVIERQNRLHRDRQWAEQLESDLAKHNQRLSDEKEAAKTKREEQRRVLEQQVHDQELRKEQQKQDLRVHTIQVIDTSRKELEEEKAEKDAAKLKIMQEREAREAMLRNHLEDRRRALEAQKEEERRYLSRIKEEEARRKEADLAKRNESKSQFQAYIRQNQEVEVKKRALKELQKEQDRESAILAKRVEEEKEQRKKLDVRRQSVRGALQAQKQDFMSLQFEARRQEEVEARKREAERYNQLVAERIEKERRDIEEQKMKRQALKSNLVTALESQLGQRQQMSDNERLIADRVRDNLSVGMMAGAYSEQRARDLQRQRKAELQQALETQIKQKADRDRHDVALKI